MEQLAACVPGSIADSQPVWYRADSNVRISVDDTTGAISLTPTSDAVNAGGGVSTKRRGLLATSSAGVESIAQTSDGSQVRWTGAVFVVPARNQLHRCFLSIKWEPGEVDREGQPSLYTNHELKVHSISASEERPRLVVFDCTHMKTNDAAPAKTKWSW